MTAEAAGQLPLEDQHCAEDPEDRARGAEYRRRRRLEERYGGTGEARYEVQADVPRGAEVLLDHPPDHEQRVHVEADVEEALVQEHRRHEPIPATMRHVRPEEHHLVVERARPVDARSCLVEAAALAGSDEIDHDVQRDERVGDRRAARRERDTRCAPHLRWLDARRGTARTDARVIRAADADRAEVRAVGADRPIAFRAREPRLAVGMPVAVTGLDRRHRN